MLVAAHLGNRAAYALWTGGTDLALALYWAYVVALGLVVTWVLALLAWFIDLHSGRAVAGVWVSAVAATATPLCDFVFFLWLLVPVHGS